MRMWMTDPRGMCRQHLLGEHFEIHSHRHNFVKGHSIAGRLFPVAQIEPASMKARHDLLALEMNRRGYKHASPYRQPLLKKYSLEEIEVKVDRGAALLELCRRCGECEARYIMLECGTLKLADDMDALYREERIALARRKIAKKRKAKFRK